MMIKLFQYHKFRELFLIEQNVEVKIDLEILGVSSNVYNLWVSCFERDSRPDNAYLFLLPTINVPL